MSSGAIRCQYDLVGNRKRRCGEVEPLLRIRRGDEQNVRGRDRVVLYLRGDTRAIVSEQIPENRDRDKEGHDRNGSAAIVGLHSCQPELSNEPPPLGAGLELPPLLPEDPLLDDGVTSVGIFGASAEGDVTGRTGCDESSGARAPSLASACAGAEFVRPEIGPLLLPPTWQCALIPVGIAIGDAPLKPSGAAARRSEIEDFGRLGAGSPEEPLPPVARPSAKQPANTASIATTNIGPRRSIRAVAQRARPARGSKRIVSRTVLMTPGTGSAWDRLARHRHRRARADERRSREARVLADLSLLRHSDLQHHTRLQRALEPAEREHDRPRLAATPARNHHSAVGPTRAMMPPCRVIFDLRPDGRLHGEQYDPRARGALRTRDPYDREGLHQGEHRAMSPGSSRWRRS